MYLIDGVIQHYAWGGDTFISQMLDKHISPKMPCAEYWLGVHAGGPSRVWLSRNASASLPDLIRSDMQRYLGTKVLSSFHNLPFLLKILDVKSMLSIQVHPTIAGAREGFARENGLAIPLDAPNRNYRDENHKPEVMVALSDFWLLHGFRTDIDQVLRQMPEFKDLMPVFDNGGIEGIYRYVMQIPQQTVDQMLQPLAERVRPLYHAGRLEKSSPDFWAARALTTMPAGNGHIDRGVYSIYFFNLVYLQPGQAIFQGAGIPHAYLEGQNVELMSNSDNVLRAGLTPKHIDIPELMRHIRFDPVKPEIMTGPDGSGRCRYPCPVPDFSMDAVNLEEGSSYTITADGPEIWFQLKGEISLKGFREIHLGAGDAVFMLPGEACHMHATSHSQLFRAFVP